MKILLLTPGTGNFHCGSCLHDEALVRGLRALGHDAAISALYLPLVLDHKEDIDGDDVQMGGIGMYLQVKSALFRWMPASIMRWLERPALLRKASSRADMTSPRELGKMSEEMLLGQHGKTRVEIDRLIKHLEAEGKPDIVLLNNALLLGLAEPISKAFDCPIACTLQGEDTFIDSLPDPWRERVWKLLSDKAKDIAIFMPVSQYHGDLMAQRIGLSADRMQVVYNGIEIKNYPPQETPPSPPVIGYLARLNPCKGLHTLIDAYLYMHRQGTDHGVHLRIVGAMTPGDEDYVDQQQDKFAVAGLLDRLEIYPNVDLKDKVKHLHGMTLLSVPATYGESFGLYVLEANACGVPVVEPNHAGLAEAVAQTQGGVVYEPGEKHHVALAEALTELLTNEAQRSDLAKRGRAGVLDRFTADIMAQNVASALESICLAPSA